MENFQEQEYGQANFNLPHDIVKLPSGGHYYKSKKSSVKVGYLTATDEDILSSAVSNNNFLYQLLRNKIYEPELRVEELLEGDIQTILIFLRNSSFGPEYTLSLTDPATNRTFPHTFILDSLTFKKPSVLPDQDGLFETKLPRSGKVVKVRPLKFGERQEIQNMTDNYPQGMVAPQTLWTFTKQIVELDGSSDKPTIVEFIKNMPILDSKHIRRFIDENEPGLNLSVNTKAPSGENVSTRIAFGVEFFRPFFGV